MQIANFYSHLNGWEHLQVHKPTLWSEIQSVITGINAQDCMTKVSKEIRTQGKMFYSPVELNKLFKSALERHDWKERRTQYIVTDDHMLILRTMRQSAAEQKQSIIAGGKTAISSYNQTDFIKDRVEIEVQFGKYSFVAYDLFVKHMAFFVGDIIDVGIEILPMKALQSNMSSGVPYYESALYDLLRQGRSTPAVPLVLVGIIP